MKCAACGHDNRQVAKFCAECGAAVASTCPACGASVDTRQKFCIECGGSLERPAASSQSAVPAGGERKHITVLFADVAGSMDLQEQLDAEVWAQIMGRFVAILAEGVRKYGGTVDKFTGDGIMALFGAPVAQEDHARRACHGAWQLTKAVGEYSEELRARQGVELHVRLGLNSGEVVVGRVGDDVTLDPTALGHTVGLAQRMEAMAEPGRAYLTEYTARLVEGWFALDDLGLKAVKGSRELLGVYALGAPSLSPPVLHGAGLGVAPLVGRERELAVLEDALAMAIEGHAQVVGVVGEAGVGKSRLCEEFAEAAVARGILVRRAAGVSHGRDVPLLPMLALLRDYFAITDADSAGQARDKVTARVLALDRAAEDALPLLFDFLEVPDPARPAPQLAAEVRLRRIFDSLRRLTQRRSEREVLVLLVEDLHCFDAQSETFLERLIESFPGSRTLVVANFRPEFSARWMRHSYYRQLALAPLPDTAVGELLGGLLGMDFSLAPLLRFIQDRTGGNPFFVEEVVRALVEDGTLAGELGSYRVTRPLQEVTVPPSVQAVLAARIDRLPAELKAVLQTASVIGRTFDTTVLGEVSHSSNEALHDAVSELCAAELLQETARERTDEYRFWHPLTQEVAYGALLTEHRRRLHGDVARAIILADPDHHDEQAALIAAHFEAAEEHLEAARWQYRAALWALRTDVADAERRWRATIDLLEHMGDAPEVIELGVRARIRLIQWGARGGADPAEIERLVENARSLAQRSGDVGLQALLMYVSGTTRFIIGDMQGALTGYVEGAHLAERMGDPALIAALSGGPILALTWAGPLHEALRWADRALTVTAGNPDLGAALIGYSPLLRALSFRADTSLHMGRFGEAKEDAERSIDMARQRSEPEILAWALTVAPRLASLTGETIDTLGSAVEAVSIGEDTGNPMSLVLGLRALAVARLLLGEPAEAALAVERALSEARSRHTGHFAEAEILACLARARLAGRDAAAARAAATEAVAVARTQGARVVECVALLTRAQVWRATGGEHDVVVGDLHAAIALVKETGALAYEPVIHEELGRLNHGERELNEALRLYRHIGATGHARRLEAELSATTFP
jgi:class 3 adenylate cyclase/tetratricopeptide (TPR) repeat protein